MKTAVVKAWLVAAALIVAAHVGQARESWIILNNCRLDSDAANDADSFHVRAAGREYIFRLYFVDAPETDESFPDRLAEQAKYFSLTTAQSLQLGSIARRFTKEKLVRPFTVRTCMQKAMGRSRQDRYYAFIEAADGDLAELLVANGLARVHGSEARPVGLSSPEREWQKLERLERQAKAQKVGAWGASVGRMTARLPAQPAKSGPDSFDAFFHPERIATPAEAEAVMEQAATASPATAGKLDPNTATEAELLAIPNIGPTLTKAIIEARPFKSADELRRVKGIGQKRYEQLRPYFN